MRSLALCLGIELASIVDEEGLNTVVLVHILQP